MSSTAQNPIRKRRVFYIPGYDPIHPRRYRELYRKEGAEQAKISGYNIELKAKAGSENFGWSVDAQIDEQQVQTDFDVLVWSDIVRTSMEGSIAQTYLLLLRTAWVYISTGALFRLMRLRKGPVIAALYPVGVLLAQLALALLAGWLSYRLITWGFGHMPTSSLAGDPLLHKIAGAGAGLGIFARVLRGFRAIDNKIFAYYLMHDYAYSASTRGANPPELEARMTLFSKQIAEACAQDYDEVLVVGHSSGAHLGVSILADVIRQNGDALTPGKLAFLSLGQVVPMVSFLPKANRLRADLQLMAAQDLIPWVDVTAPGDGCAFALCDPVGVSGVAPTGKRWPLVFSAAFTQTLSAEKLKTLKRRYFRLHFQYLCAFDRPKDYDYFQITAGPIGLGVRYKDRPASKSRIEHAVNAHTSIAA